MEVRTTCPLGSECESAKDGYVERCAWYTEIRGTDASGKSEDRWQCAITWFPLLQVEQTQSSRFVASSIQSLRNETVKRQETAIQELKGRLDGSATSIA